MSAVSYPGIRADFNSGPSEVSIFNPEAVPLLLGPGSKCTKADWYDANYPVISLHTLRDKGAHDARRRIWDRGFGAKGLVLKFLISWHGV
jgi:hypothetical protein